MDLPLGRYKVTDRPSDSWASPVRAAAYLTRHHLGRCISVQRAIDGRVVLHAIGRATAQGAFALCFSTGRYHGTFSTAGLSPIHEEPENA